MFCYILGEQQLMSFFIQDLHLNFHSFLGFQHGSDSSVNAIMLLSATLPLAIGLKCFWFLIALLLYQSQPCLDYLSSIQQIFAYQTSFRENLDKSFLTYILNLMSKKILGSFNDLISTYFQYFICLPRYEHFLASIFCKVSLALLNRIGKT